MPDRNHWTMRHGMPTNTYSRQATFNFCPIDGRTFVTNEANCPLCGTEREIFHFVRRIKNGMERLDRYAELEEEYKITTSTSPSPVKGDKRWRKLLYINQDYPDNYVDNTFLEEMQKNANVKTYDYWTVVKQSGVVTQHLSSIAIFISVFVLLYNQSLSVKSLVSSSVLLSLLAYILWDALMQQKFTSLISDSRIKIFSGAILFSSTLLGLSPILKTLTRDTSDDTIWALTFCFLFLNLLFHEYGSKLSSTIKFPGSFSTNAAIFASVLLASRLPSNSDVFGLMLFAVQWFALFPIFRRTLRAVSDSFNLLLTILLVLTTVSFLWNISNAFLSVYLIIILFISFICPLWLIWIQRYKNAIEGPWDEAPLVLSSKD